MKKNYKNLLKNAPKHDSVDFLEYLRKNNKVVFDNPQWIVIQNAKYHTKKKPWYTAFHKPSTKGLSDWCMDIDILWYIYGPTWNYLVKSDKKQTIKRQHVHIHK